MIRPKLFVFQQTACISSAVPKSPKITDFEVHSAGNISDAFDLLATEVFDGILVDLQGAQDVPFLIATIRTFQPEAVIITSTDPSSEQQVDFSQQRDLYGQLPGDYVQRFSNAEQISELINIRMRQRTAKTPRDRRLA
jgi:hypothetical protein